jgi:hypothetical protein
MATGGRKRERGEKYNDEIDLSLLVPEDDARGQ